MKYLLWQFSSYAAVAVMLGIVVGRWSMATRVATAERDRHRAAFELSSLTMKASALLEAAGRERSSIVDANGRLAEELRAARESQMRIEADLHAAEHTRVQAEVSLHAVAERFAAQQAASSASTDDRSDVARLSGELAHARDELARLASESSVELARVEARARTAEAAHLELSRVHAAAVRSAQAELTRALVRAEQAEALLPAMAARGAQAARIADTVRPSDDRILDLRPFDRSDDGVQDRRRE